MIFQAGMSFGQEFGIFEMRLVEPGLPDPPGIFRVQMRPTSTVLPTTGDVCSELVFTIWWDPVANPGIMDVTVVSGLVTYTVGPVGPESSTGTGPIDGVGVVISLQGTAQFPTNWVLNKWEQIATINICSNTDCSPAGAPPGIDATDFLIQDFDEETGPVIGINSNGIDYIPSISLVLPLNLIAFHATKSGDRDAHVTWTTANEENTSHFIVERSFDKNTWETVGTVGAAGNSVDIRNYELTDLEVNNGRASRVRAYYRLKMVDLDGRSATSPIESIIYDNASVTAAVNNFEVFPNPASDGVYVTWDKVENLDQPSLMELFDITGKLILRQVISDKADQEYIDLESANVKAGVYMLRIMNGTTPLDHKQIVVGQN